MTLFLACLVASEPAAAQGAALAAVYEALGRTDEFEAILEYDAGLAPTAARAWQIVESEGPEAFVREVREAGRTP